MTQISFKIYLKRLIFPLLIKYIGFNYRAKIDINVLIVIFKLSNFLIYLIIKLVYIIFYFTRLIYKNYILKVLLLYN